MSCEACTEAQEDGLKVPFYRWKNANVLMMGCDEHLKEVFAALNMCQNMERLKKVRTK